MILCNNVQCHNHFKLLRKLMEFIMSSGFKNNAMDIYEEAS